MAHSSKIFESQPVRVQNVNGFDLSHLFSGTAYTGTLTPCLCWMLMPGTKFSLGATLQCELPPLATSAFGRVDAHIEVFWVNCSILYGGWKQFISNNPPTSFIATQGNLEYKLPVWNMSTDNLGKITLLDGSNYCLLDYLNFNGYNFSSGPAATTVHFNLLPLLAYHRIWDVFYRNPQVTRTIFAVNPDTNDTGFIHNVAFVHHSYYRNGTGSSTSPLFDTNASCNFPDGTSIFSLRQRNYPNDYYTSASPDTQLGNAPTLGFTVDTSTGDGEFTIRSLRAVNSLTRFLEINNMDPTYRGILRANFGVSPGDAESDEPIYLGRLVVPVYQKGVYNTSSASGDPSSGTGTSSTNPFVNGRIGTAIIGAKSAVGSFNGEGSIVSKFKVTSFGYLVGLFSLVPHAQYSQGIHRMHRDINIGDFPFPILQSVGMDSIKSYEVYASSVALNSDSDWAYLPRYSRFKYLDDSVHGELRVGKSLESFVIQRNLAAGPTFNTAFCQIPKNALDNMFAIDSDTMMFSCWFEVFWSFKAVMPLAEFCTPTLGELQDTHEIKMKQGGSRL